MRTVVLETEAGPILFRDYTLEVAGRRFGFYDMEPRTGAEYTHLELGPWGLYNSPVTAIQGTAAVCVGLLLVVVIPFVVMLRRHKRPRA
jgi:hypothetical protein